MNLNKLAEDGSYFIYDLDALKLHTQKIVSGEAELFFACKANPLSSVLSVLNDAGSRFDVASEGELVQVLSIGVKGENIIMTGPAKPINLMRLALENEVSVFVIESESQLDTLQRLAIEYNYTPKILLRLQLQWDLEEKSVLGGSEITPFGMDLNTARNILPKITLPFLGFHVFQWGNILSIEKLVDIWENTLVKCRSLVDDFEVLDVGGGFGIPYDKNQTSLNWDEVNQAIKDFKQKNGLKRFWLEMGRYLTGPSGIYITKVVDVKTSYNRDIIVLEGGINHIARPALVKESFPAELMRKSDADSQLFYLHGPLCTSLDFLGKYMLPSDIKTGDIIIFKQVGAYGFTESMPFFLCHNLPGEAIIENGNIKIIREIAKAKIWLK